MIEDQKKFQKLTEKEEKFVREYLLHGNAAEAARQAGYKKEPAEKAGYEVKNKPHVRYQIQKMKARTAELAGITRLGVAMELKKIGFSNLASFKDGWLTEKDFSEIPFELKACLSEIQYVKSKDPESGYEKAVVKFKVHDKLKALEMINKMFGFNEPEKQEFTGGTGTNIIVNNTELSDSLKDFVDEVNKDISEES